MSTATLTTMCAIVNGNGEWVFIDREKNWCGLALPGGHVKDNESIYECVFREVLEETGLRLNEVQFKGLFHFFNISTHERYTVFSFISDSFSGTLKKSCSEGDLYWLRPENIDCNQLSEGMAERFELFNSPNCLEMFVEWDEHIGKRKVRKQFLF